MVDLRSMPELSSAAPSSTFQTIFPQTTRRRSLALLAALIIGSGCHAAPVPPKPIAVQKFEKPLSAQPATVDATVNFLGENTVAARICTPFDWRAPARTCRLELATLGDKDLRTKAEVETPEKPAWTKDMFALPNGAVLLNSSNGQYRYSPDLKARRDISIPNLVASATPSAVVGGTTPAPPDEQGAWTLYRISPWLATIREGRGTLYDVSEDYVMFFIDGTVRIETLDGRLLGLHRVEVGPTPYYDPEIIGPGRLYLGGKKPAIADFNGRELLNLRIPKGFGARDSWSAGGGRMLFDHFVDSPTTLTDLIGKYLPPPIPKDANGEVIWVVDTANAGICFEWNSPGQLLGMVGQRHAALSPSGRLVAVVTTDGISVFRLPEACVLAE
jgi:hypothetical protein